MPKTCPTCFETDEDRRSSCINRINKMCPDPVNLKETKAVEIVCAAPCGGPCGKHLAIPIGSVMKRRQLTNLGTCAHDVCRARVVLPSKAKPSAKPTPPAITEANGAE